MPIIYTYPAKNTPVGSDLIIISDSEANKITKRATLSTAVTNNQIKYDLNATQDGSNVDLNLTSSDASDNSVVQFTAGTNVSLTRNSASEITISASGGGNLPIEDEGTEITAAAAKINFAGAGVTATAAGNDVTVNIPGGGGGGTPGGSDTQIQYNNSGSFGGTTGLTWDDSTNILSIATRYEGDIDGALLQQVLVKESGGVSKGDVVYISGGTGDNPEVMKAQSNSSTTMPALGIMKANTAEDAIGECITSGELTGVNLGSFSTGDELFVSNATPGRFISSAPTSEDKLIQKIGKVIKGGTGGALTVLGAFRTNATPNLNQGSIFIGNGSNQASTLAIGTNTHVLTSNGTTASWQAIPSSGVTNFTNSNGTFVSFSTTNTNATGAVTVGSVDLSATGTPSSSNFLRGDNAWAVPVNTTYTFTSPSSGVLRLNDGSTNQDVTVSGGAGITINQLAPNNVNVDLDTATATAKGGIELFSNTVQSVAANAVSSTANRTYGLQLNAAGQGVVNVPWTSSGGSSNGAILGTNIYHNDSTSPNLPAAFSFGTATTFNQVQFTTSVGAVTQNVGITINRPAGGFVRIQVQCYVLSGDSNNIYLGLHHTAFNTIAGSAMQYGWLNPGHSADNVGQVYELNTYWDIDGRDFVEQGEEGPEQVAVGSPATFYLKGTATNSSTDMLFANRGAHSFTVGGVQAGWNGGLNLPTNTADCGGPCIITAYALESATRSVNPGTTP